MTTIVTTSPPVASPKRYSGTLGTSLANIIDVVPDYEITRTTSGQVTTTTRDGVAEIISPLFLTNKTGTTRHASVKITRDGGATAWLLYQQDIAPNETLILPINGQVLLTGDTLSAQAEASAAIDATLSWTQGEAEPDGT